LSLPQSNATLTSIRAAGLTEDWNQAATTGTVKWSGASPAYVRERVIVSAANGTLDEFRRTSIIVPGNLTPAVSITRGDAVTFTYAGTSRTRTVRDYAARLLPGMLSTVLIELEDA
jgi:hypothetical protein